MEPPGVIAEIPRHFIVRHDSESDFIGNENSRGLSGFKRRLKPLGCGFNVMLTEHQICDPEREAIDEDRVIGLKSRGEVKRGLDRNPSGFRAVGLVPLDTLPHFLVPNFRGRDIDPGRGQRLDQTFRMACFAGAGTA